MAQDHEFGRSAASPSLASPSLANEPATPSTEDFLAAFLDFTPGPGNPQCSDPQCGHYPHYGVAPHECFYKRGAEFGLGQSLMLPRAKWPANFVLGLEPGEDPETVAYPSACGVYYCPTCLHGMPPEDGSQSPVTSDGEVSKAAQPLQTTEPKGEV